MRGRLSGRSWLAVAAGACAVLVTVAGCGDPPASGPRADKVPDIPMATSVGAGEGQLNLVAWAGYAEDGSNDKNQDWVHPFTAATGCVVNVKTANTSDEMLTLMKTGQYDGVSASGDATLRLVYGGVVAPVNTDLVPNYATVADFLKNRPWNSVGGRMYGIPHGWGANVLMYNPAVVKQAPTSWGAVFDPGSPYKGRITAYDSPIYFADAALYLMRSRPELKITNPYALDRHQLDAAVELLKQLRHDWSRPWAAYTDEVQDFESGASVIGTAWQLNANTINADGKVKVETTVPAEGATGWSDTWMIAAKAAHPNCMYKWLDRIVSPTVNAQVAQWFGEAPAQTRACEQAAAGFCEQYHALDRAYADKVFYWTTPTRHCLDGRGDVCTDYATWTQAWTEIKG